MTGFSQLPWRRTFYKITVFVDPFNSKRNWQICNDRLIAGDVIAFRRPVGGGKRLSPFNGGLPLEYSANASKVLLQTLFDEMWEKILANVDFFAKEKHS